jgi:transposase-like protein
MEACGHSPVWEGQRVERTNARGRDTYVPAFKRWIVEQARRPGMSVAGLALSNQVNANQLRRWIQLHGSAAAATPALGTALLPVTVVSQRSPELPPRVPSAAIEIEAADTIVRVHDGAAAATLRMVLACLRSTAP